MKGTARPHACLAPTKADRLVRADDECRGCHAPIRWVTAIINGQRIAIDPSPVRDGNIWIDHIEGGAAWCHMVLTPEDVPASEPFRYVAHVVTCPARQLLRDERR